MYNRQLVRAFLEIGQDNGYHVKTLVLNDRTGDVDDRYIPRGAPHPSGFSRNKWLFGAATLANALRLKPEIVVFGHVHFARIARLVHLLSPRSRLWFIVYGIEVWRPLPAAICRGLALADETLSISDFSRKELSRNGKIPEHRIRLLPCALDPVWQAQHTPDAESPVGVAGRPRTLLTVARLAASERFKGLDSVISALPEVAKTVPDVVYEVVGDGSDRARLERLAQTLGVADRVRFRGRLSPDDLAAAYRDCTLFVMPSAKEGFGIVFLEAGFFGKPSIAGRHGGSPEVVADAVTGLLVDREDVPGLASALVQLLVNDELRCQMGAEARATLMDRFCYTKFRDTLRGFVSSSEPRPESRVTNTDQRGGQPT